MSNPTSGGVANTDGCALSYLSHYVGRFDLTAATNIWDQYKNDFLTTTVIGTGFREYLIDYKCQWTPDSGPIVLWLGAAATGIGLNAASTISDRDTFIVIEKNLSRISCCSVSSKKSSGIL